MSRSRDREEFIALLTSEGVPLDVCQRVLRHATTHHRLAEAECNGDWPCDDGERATVPCSRCEMGYVASTLVKGVCRRCRAEDRIRELLAPYGVMPVFQGDPRGATVKLQVPSGKTNDWEQTGLCVP